MDFSRKPGPFRIPFYRWFQPEVVFAVVVSTVTAFILTFGALVVVEMAHVPMTWRILP